MLISRRALFPTLAGAAFAQPAPDSPIGRLRNRKAEAVPITIEERKARQEKARRLMSQHGLAAICLSGGTSLNYFSNVRWGNSERLFTMVIPAKGEPFFVSPSFEEERAREQIATGPGGKDPRVLVWDEDADPYVLVAKGLKEKGITSGKIGVEEKVPFVFSDGIAKATGGMTVVSATPVTAGCRVVKSPAEIALMRLASSVTLAAYEAAYLSMREGMTQIEFGALVSAAHQKQGFNGYASVQTGEYSALPHGSAKPQVLREGTILLMDGGCTVEGYQSDLSRTFVMGKPTDKMRRIFDFVLKAQTAALKAAKPGVRCGDVDAAARKVIEDAGYGPGYKYFTHRVGHGIGMDMHEWPYLVKDNKLPLAPGMTFSDEPGIYLPGEFGVRLEDDLLITETGGELLTPQSPSIDRPFARN
jgi:Xaa-Pro dipeptidase